ncbi:unnamed protein product [Amoebophrya sp. A120]|nr:unnamed protein product [Amoebophrya sp. A120]|eukprot:GSA120T00008400001.1
MVVLAGIKSNPRLITSWDTQVVLKHNLEVVKAALETPLITDYEKQIPDALKDQPEVLVKGIDRGLIQYLKRYRFKRILTIPEQHGLLYHDDIGTRMINDSLPGFTIPGNRRALFPRWSEEDRNNVMQAALRKKLIYFVTSNEDLLRSRSCERTGVELVDKNAEEIFMQMDRPTQSSWSSSVDMEITAQIYKQLKTFTKPANVRGKCLVLKVDDVDRTRSSGTRSGKAKTKSCSTTSSLSSSTGARSSTKPPKADTSSRNASSSSRAASLCVPTAGQQEGADLSWSISTSSPLQATAEAQPAALRVVGGGCYPTYPAGFAIQPRVDPVDRRVVPGIAAASSFRSCTSYRAPRPASVASAFSHSSRTSRSAQRAPGGSGCNGASSSTSLHRAVDAEGGGPFHQRGSGSSATIVQQESPTALLAASTRPGSSAPEVLRAARSSAEDVDAGLARRRCSLGAGTASIRPRSDDSFLSQLQRPAGENRDRGVSGASTFADRVHEERIRQERVAAGKQRSKSKNGKNKIYRV